MSHISHMTVSSDRPGWLARLSFGLLGRSGGRAKGRVKHRRQLGPQRAQSKRKGGNTMYELMKKHPASDR